MSEGREFLIVTAIALILLNVIFAIAGFFS